MLRTLVLIVVLLTAVLWLPLWIQIVFFVAAILIGPYRVFLLVPAIVSDALYAPGTPLSFTAHWMTLLVLGLLGLHWFIMKKLRIRTVYGLEA